jgi:hypothetical protein
MRRLKHFQGFTFFKGDILPKTVTLRKKAGLVAATLLLTHD